MRNQNTANWDVETPRAAVAIDKDKSSQNALKWTLENLVSKGQTMLLIHVKHKNANNISNEAYIKDIFLPFRCFCTRKDVHCKDVILDDCDIAKGIIDYVAQNAIEKLIVGTSSRTGFARFKTTDVPSSITKGAPDFCTVYVISKGRVSSQRNAVRPAPTVAHFRSQTQSQSQTSIRPDYNNVPHGLKSEWSSNGNHSEEESIVSPFTRAGARGTVKPYIEFAADTDISFVSSSRQSSDQMFPSLYEELDSQRPPRISSGSDMSDMMRLPIKQIMDAQTIANDYSFSQESRQSSWSSQPTDDSEAEMRMLRLQLKQTMEAYNAACKEALTSQKKAKDLQHWKLEKEQRMEEAKLKEENALAVAEMEKAKCRAAVEAAEAAKWIAELEAQKRLKAETCARKEAEEKRKVLEALANTDVRYRRYTIEEIEVATDYFSDDRKVGEGGYGPVYRSYLDHTQVAIKVLRPDAAQGRSQFQQEVEVLSRMRHPNMVLLLGACPEYGCLVYEYMANGSLEDRLFRRGNTPVLPWQIRFRIAAEISTGLLFLHQTKPEPLVHRDLKPANILLDHNYVSKISDVGLARLVPPSVSNEVTQYRMTSAAGTFCYIDPEYQQTGMLGIKSDIYSLGILLLQIITGKPPMGLTHQVERSIEKGEIEEMLDPAVKDWPVTEALQFANIALQCSQLRRKDRPDLGSEVLPEMNRLRAIADENMYLGILDAGSNNASPMHSVISQDNMTSYTLTQSEAESIKSRSSTSSNLGRRLSLS